MTVRRMGDDNDDDEDDEDIELEQVFEQVSYLFQPFQVDTPREREEFGDRPEEP